MAWQFNPYAIPLFFGSIPLSGIALIAWRARQQLIVRVFFWYTVFALGLILSYAMELLSANLATMMIWLRFEYLFHWGVVIWVLFLLAYTGSEQWLTRKRLIAVFTLPALILFLACTNSYHHLIWSSAGVQTVNNLVLFDRTYGPAFWVWIGYLYFIGIVSAVVLFWNFMRWPELYRGQAKYLLMTYFVTWIGSILSLSHLNPFPLLDLAPYGIALSCIPTAMALFRYKLLDMVPKAYHQVIKSMDDMVIVADNQSRIVELNPTAERFLKASTSQLIGQKTGTTLRELRGFRDEMPYSTTIQYEVVYGEGEAQQYFDLRISPLLSGRGKLSGNVMVIRDITDQVHTEQRALELAIEQEKFNVLETLLKTASHDLKTPISIIKTSNYLVKKYTDQMLSLIHAPKPEELETVLVDLNSAIAHIQQKNEASETGTQRLEQIIDSVLQIIRMERGQEYTYALQSVNGFMEMCIEACRAEAEGKNLRLDYTSDPTLPQISMDINELKQAVGHVLKNAIDYTAAGGVVRVKTHDDKQMVLIEICDSGTGIVEDDLPHIFEWFYRADEARSTGGAGLGLPIAQHIVERHGGRIEVESVVNKGSTFRIYLPHAQEQKAT